MNEGINQVCEPRAERAPQPLAPIDERPNKIRQINIEELNYGYIVRVGCHNFAIETKAQLIAQLSAYIQDPAITEKKWFDGKLL